MKNQIRADGFNGHLVDNEFDEVGDIDIADTQSDQSESDEETPTTSAEMATPMSWTRDDISSVNVAYTGHFPTDGCPKRLHLVKKK